MSPLISTGKSQRAARHPRRRLHALPVRPTGGSFCRNPQVRNGLRLSGTGLLTRNYRPRLFTLSRLTDGRATRVPRSTRRLTTQRGTNGHREYEMRMVVRVP